MKYQDYEDFVFAFAAIRIGISGSASFQSVRKSIYAALALAVSRCVA